MTKRAYDIAVIGDWHLAFITAACLADSGHKVALINPLVTQREWSEFPHLPISEPGLSEMIARNVSLGRLHFENGIDENWKARFVWLAVDTPVDDKDRPDVRPLKEIVQRVELTQMAVETFIVSSQVPLGFGRQSQEQLRVPTCYVPENLRLGHGIETFYRADRTVLGADEQATLQRVKSLLSGFKTEFLECNLPTAEMIKHANNIFLATSISFSNELARLGEKFGVDSQLVGQALKLDKRIGPKAYVSPGLGFAGGTLPRDLRVIQSLGEQKKVPTPLVDAVLAVNEQTADALAESVMTQIPQSGSVLLMGYSYKADTNTLRRSPTVDLAKILSRMGARCWGYDPVANDQDLSELSGFISHCSKIEDLIESPDMIVVMTGRTQFKDFPWNKIGCSQTHPAQVLDTQGIVSKEAVIHAGFRYRLIWSDEEGNL